jgi:hypothetical protein
MKSINLIFLALILSCDNSQSQKNQSTSNIQLNAKEVKDEWELNKYRNYEHKFRIEFPENYGYDNGTTLNTVARSYNKKFGVTFSVLVINTNLTNEYPSDITKIQTLSDVKSEFKNNNRNLEFKNVKVESCFLNNYPAYCTYSTRIVKSGDIQMNYISSQIKCLKDNKIYQVTLNMPLDLWDEDYENMYNRVVGSFNFE